MADLKAWLGYEVAHNVGLAGAVTPVPTVVFPPLALGADASLAVTDGIGEVDDTVSLVLEGDYGHLTVNPPDMLAVSINGRLFGPYDLESVKEREGAVTLFGRVDDHFEDHFIDASTAGSTFEEFSLFEIIVTPGVSPLREAIESLASQPPFSRFDELAIEIAPMAGVITRVAWDWSQQLVGQVAGASDLGGVRSVLGANGILISPRASLVLGRFTPRNTAPRLRPPSGSYSEVKYTFALSPQYVVSADKQAFYYSPVEDRLGWLRLQALRAGYRGAHAVPPESQLHDVYGVPTTVPSTDNGPRAYLTRRIELGEFLKEGAGSALVEIASSGTDYPVIRLRPQLDVVVANVALDLERWRLQNRAADAELDMTLDVLVQPHTLLKGLQGAEITRQTTWWVESVQHTVSPTDGDRTTASIHLWQGGPEEFQVS